jgi:uncharacterized membrane protein YfcA
VHWFLIGLIGAGVGFLGGMFGKGGSAIATPLLAAIGVPPIIAVASPLPATIPGTLVAYRRYRGGGHSDPRIIHWSLAFGLPATIAGALVTHWIGGGFLVKLTDAIVAVLGLRIVLEQRRPTATAPAGSPSVSAVRLASVAMAVGFLAGLLANAGGFLLVPLYLAVLHLPIKKALANSLAVASVLAVPGTIVHAALGHIDWRVAAVFGVASIPLSSLGARTALAMNPARLERVYGAGLLTLGVTLLILG